VGDPGAGPEIFSDLPGFLEGEEVLPDFKGGVTKPSPKPRADSQRTSGGLADVDSADFYRSGTQILGAFQMLTFSERPGWADTQRYALHEEERFRLWAQSQGLQQRGHDSLDYRVRDIAVVKHLLHIILTDLRDHVENLLSLVRGDRQPFESENIEEDEEENDESPSDSGVMAGNLDVNPEGSASSELPSEVDFRRNSITEAVDALYRMAVRLREPKNRPQRTIFELGRSAPSQLRLLVFEVEELDEVAAVSHLQRIFLRSDGFERGADVEDHTSSSYMVQRVAIANTWRKLQFINWNGRAITSGRVFPTISRSTGPGLQPEWPDPPADLLISAEGLFACPYCNISCPDEYLANNLWR